MNGTTKVIIFSLAFIFLACYAFHEKPPDSTNIELIKLLSYYKQDSLKLKAARFLINNMSDKESEFVRLQYADGNQYTPNSFEDIQAIKKQIDSLNLFYEVEYKPDEDNITANFLITNIDLAFQQWFISPWKDKVDFGRFCEYILPYRIGKESLEDWRTVSLERFSWLKDSIKKNISYDQIICLINDSLKSQFAYGNGHFKNDNSLSLSELLKCKKGSCEAMTNIALFNMRSFGIPVMKDFTPAWASANGGHSWNSIYLESGELCSFMGCESCPDPNNPNLYFPFNRYGNKTSDRPYHRSAKVYRHTYSIQEDPLTTLSNDSQEIPPFFRLSTQIKDVTSEYMPTQEVRLRLRNNSVGQKVVYLCVFNTGKWVPVSWSDVSATSEVIFKNMGKDIIYLLGMYKEGIMSPLSIPFLLTEKGKTKFLIPDTNNRQDLLLKARSLYHPHYPIKTGEQYSLYCWKKKSWVLLTQKKASVDSISFDKIPVNGFYQLRSHTSNGIERPFLFDGNGPIWY